MATLVVGASGATGSLLIEQLLDCGQQVRAVVRDSSRLPDRLRDREGLSVIQASIHDASDAELAGMVNGCGAIASCLGHNLTLRGLFGRPRRLVTDVTRRLCRAARSSTPGDPVRFVLMNTAGNANRDIREPVSLAHRCVIQMLRLGLPPHRDNELAADCLRTEVGQRNASVEWVVVRPDTLISEPTVTEYTTHSSPTRCALFNPGKTSRVNTAHFMSQLIVNDDLWTEWAGKMPVIYNAG